MSPFFLPRLCVACLQLTLSFSAPMALEASLTTTRHGVNEFMKRRGFYSLRCGAVNACSVGFIYGLTRVFSKDIARVYDDVRRALMQNQAIDNAALPQLPDEFDETAIGNFMAEICATAFVNEVKTTVATAVAFSAADAALLLYKHNFVGDAAHAHCAAEALLSAPFAAAAAKAINLELGPDVAFRGLLSSLGLVSFTRLGVTREVCKWLPFIPMLTPRWVWQFHLPVVVKVPDTFEHVDEARKVATCQDMMVWHVVSRVASQIGALVTSSCDKSLDVVDTAARVAVEVACIWGACQPFVDGVPIVGKWGNWGRSCLACALAPSLGNAVAKVVCRSLLGRTKVVAKKPASPR